MSIHRKSCVVTAIAFGLIVSIATSEMSAQVAVKRAVVRNRQGVAGNLPKGGTVNLPYFVQDKSGNQWMVYQGGWFRQNGNMPVYSQGGQLMVNGNSPNMNNNQAQVDADTGEIVLENMQANNVTVTRRLKVNADDGSMRVIDVFTATGNAEVQLSVGVQSNLNFGVQSAEMVKDDKDKEQTIGWVAMTHGNRAAMEWYGGSDRAPVKPEVNWQQGNNIVQATYQLTVPGGKQIAIVHVHQTAGTQQQAADMVGKIDTRALLADVPKDLRKIIVNVRSVSPLLADLELLRGDVLDVVELRNGDRVTGTLTEQTFKLNAPFGPIDITADRVLGAFNVGDFKPRQLFVTTDGQILGGTLAKETIDLSLPGGQTTAIPLRQISRVGFRKRSGEAEEVVLTQPNVVLTPGDRVAIVPPTAPLALATRYGLVSIPAAAVASVALQDDQSPVHVIYLTDGTVISGLLTTPEFDLQLVNGPAIKLPVSGVAAVHFVVPTDPALPGTPDARRDELSVLRTVGDDALVGTLSGQLELATAFDVIKLDATGIRGLVRTKRASSDVQVTTWDGATISGQLANDSLTFNLTAGVTLTIPVGLVDTYVQPQPQPSSTMLEQIKTVVADLSAEDWKQRDLAEAQLVSMGPSVAAVLKQLRASQPAEAQQRIDSVLKQVEGKK
jgi:hypothetical protein